MNHFIEIDRGEEGELYLLVHTGSRRFGKQVAEYYQREAIRQHQGYEAGRKEELQGALKKIRSSWKPSKPDVPDDLAYLKAARRELGASWGTYAAGASQPIISSELGRLAGKGYGKLTKPNNYDNDKTRK